MNNYQKLLKSSQDEIKTRLASLLKSEVDRLLVSRKSSTAQSVTKNISNLAQSLSWIVAQDFDKSIAESVPVPVVLGPLAHPKVRKSRVDRGRFLMANIKMEVTYQDQCGLNAVEFMALKNHGPMRWQHLDGTEVVKCKTVPFNGYQMKLDQLTDVIYDK